MAVSKTHGLYAVEAGAAVIGGITQCNASLGTSAESEATSGEVFARQVAIRAQSPAASFTTLAIAQMLAIAGTQGVDIATLTGGIKLYLQKFKDGGTREGASSHRKYAIADGIMVPQTLSVQHQQDAQLPYQIITKYDGSNDPIVESDGVSVPSGVADNQRFSLGPVTIAGVTIDHVKSLDLDFGIDAQTEGADGDVWDTQTFIRFIRPVLTIRGIDPTWLKSTNIPRLGKAATHANTTFYLKKRADAGTFVANGSAVHIKFTADGLATVDQPFDASGQDAAETVLTLRMRYDGTNDPVVVTLNSVIA